ncbi:GrpB family protein [Rhodophyticola sp. CCM32]|nr:GrpB family protein [Rhodophyticola sp. CCM32]
MAPLLLPHDPAWKPAFDREAKAIRLALGEGAIILHHIGSTAIPGILAKPIIDMLGIVDRLVEMDCHNPIMQGLGYEVMGEYGIETRRYFRKSDEVGQRTHHLHVFEQGSHHTERHLAFRDYLRNNTREAAEYSDLKSQVASECPSAEAYGHAKAPFIAHTEKRALEWYRRNQTRDQTQ